jgi:hypothetical protein
MGILSRHSIAGNYFFNGFKSERQGSGVLKNFDSWLINNIVQYDIYTT